MHIFLLYPERSNVPYMVNTIYALRSVNWYASPEIGHKGPIMRKTYPGPDVIILHIDSELTLFLVSTYNYCSSGLHSVRYDEASVWCSVELHGIINDCRAEFISENMNMDLPLLSVRDTVIDMWYKVCFGAYRKMQRYYANQPGN